MFHMMAMMQGGSQKQVAAYGDGVLKTFLGCNLQNQNNGLWTRDRVHLVKTGEDVLW